MRAAGPEERGQKPLPRIGVVLPWIFPVQREQYPACFRALREAQPDRAQQVMRGAFAIDILIREAHAIGEPMVSKNKTHPLKFTGYSGFGSRRRPSKNVFVGRHPGKAEITNDASHLGADRAFGWPQTTHRLPTPFFNAEPSVPKLNHRVVRKTEARVGHPRIAALRVRAVDQKRQDRMKVGGATDLREVPIQRA